METDILIKERIEAILPILDERQRRIYLAAEAKSIGWGGKSKIANLSSVASPSFLVILQQPLYITDI